MTDCTCFGAYCIYSFVCLFLELFEERALLLSRLGRHEVALAIYAHILKEPELAEE